MSEKVEQFKEVIKIINNSLTREEFMVAFKALNDFVKKVEKNLSIAHQNGVQEMAEKIAKNEQPWAMKWNKDLEAQNNLVQQIQAGLRSVNTELAKLNAVAPINVEQISLEAITQAVAEVLPLIPEKLNLEAELPQYGAAIRDGLELLPEGEKLKIEAIENLREELDKMERKFASRTNLGGLGGNGTIPKPPTKYSISSQFNGVLKTFSLPTFLNVLDVRLFSTPLLEEDVDYTIDPNAMTITFGATIDAASQLSAGQTGLVLLNH